MLTSYKKLLSDQDFMIVIHSNVLSAMPGFRDKDVLLPIGHNVIVSPPSGNAAQTFPLWILKERP